MLKHQLESHLAVTRGHLRMVILAAKAFALRQDKTTLGQLTKAMQIADDALSQASNGDHQSTT